MPIPVHCPECGAKLKAPDKAEGQVLSCPRCQAPMRIPRIREAIRADTAPSRAEPGEQKRAPITRRDTPIASQTGCAVPRLGCLVFLAVMAGLVIVAFNYLWTGPKSRATRAAVEAERQKARASEHPTQAQDATPAYSSDPPSSDLWTKANTPSWVDKLPDKVKTAFRNMMNDSSPLYTGIFCNGATTKVYINRAEWKRLSRFQATNNLMLASLLPHTDETRVEYLDDESGQTLASFTVKQSLGSIDVVHP